MSGSARRAVPLAVLALSMTTGTAFAGEYGDLTDREQANIRNMEIATAAFFLALGCSIGSFLNVVAYRLPAGMPLGKPKSHCPHCKTPLGRHENLPVLGWLLLRGRCRHCSARISPRYPLVEAIVGAAFVVLLFVELLSGGANLPVRTPNTFAGVVWIVWYTKWDLVGLYLFHCCLLCVMTAIALIAIDRARIPRSLVLWSVGVGVLFPTVWPTLHPVPFVVPRPEWLAAYDWRVEWIDMVFSAGWKHSVGISLAGFLDSTAGLAGGLLCGFVVAIAERDPRLRHDVLATFSILGTFLGWQAALSVASATTLLGVLGLALARGGRPVNVPILSVVAVLTLGQILSWRWLSSVDFWPSHRGLPVLAWPGDSTLQLVGLVLLLSATNWGLRRLGRLDDVDPFSASLRASESQADEVSRGRTNPSATPAGTEVAERSTEPSSER